LGYTPHFSPCSSIWKNGPEAKLFAHVQSHIPSPLKDSTQKLQPTERLQIQGCSFAYIYQLYLIFYDLGLIDANPSIQIFIGVDHPWQYPPAALQPATHPLSNLDLRSLLLHPSTPKASTPMHIYDPFDPKPKTVIARGVLQQCCPWLWIKGIINVHWC
jgi:hypothetical protein